MQNLHRPPVFTRPLLSACLVGLSLLPSACNDIAAPAISRLRPGDSLLDVMDTARLSTFPDTLLPEQLSSWRDRTTGTSMWRVPDTEWWPVMSVPSWVAESLDLGGEPTVWHAAIPSMGDFQPAEARLWHDGELLVPHAWPASSALSQNIPAWHDEARQLVVSWDAGKRLLSVVSVARPGALRVEYPVDPSELLAGLDCPHPENVSELLDRVSFGRIERRALRLPAAGTIELDLTGLPSPSLELSVAVSEASWTTDNDFLMRTPGRGDGVTFAVDVIHEGVATRAWSRHLKAGEGWHSTEVDLSAWLGQDITLRLASEPGADGDASFDEAFWAGLRLRGGADASPRRPDIVFIDIDTLRADRLGCTGHARNTSPRLDRWVEASGATVFSDCIATSSWTLPSTMSMLTGLHVFQHGVDRARQALPDSIPTLAELLSGAGYESAAWVEGGYTSARHGFGRGFDSYDATTERNPDWSDVLEWMANRRSERPCFVFLQTYMVHAPYPHDARYWRGTAEAAIPLDGAGVTAGSVFLPFRHGTLELDQAEREYVDLLYDAGVRRMDDVLGAFLEGLDELFEQQDVLVVITSDHGEELFDHGGLDHGRTLYQEVLQVPLIVRWPLGNSPSAEAPRTLLDLAPTLLQQAGVPVPATWPGRSLLDDPAADRLRVAKLGLSGLSVQRGSLKLIRLSAGAATGRSAGVQLFDLSSDRGERHNLAGSRPDVADELMSLWEEYKARLGGAVVAPGLAAPMDAETMQMLDELGYVDDR